MAGKTSEALIKIKTKGAKEAEKSFKRVGNEVSNTANLLRTVFVGAVGYAALNMVKLAGEAAGVEKAFNKLNRPGLLDRLRDASMGAVSDLELMKKAVQAKNFKIPLEVFASGLEFATKKAIETGQSVDYLVDSFVTGMGRKSLPILDNLQISITEVQTTMKNLGVTFEEAVGMVVNKGLEDMGDVAATTATKIQGINAKFENLKVTFGKLLEGPAGETLDRISQFLEDVENNAERVGQLWTLLRIGANVSMQDFEKAKELVREYWSEVAASGREKEVIRPWKAIADRAKETADEVEKSISAWQKAYNEWVKAHEGKIAKQKQEAEFLEHYNNLIFLRADIEKNLIIPNMEAMTVSYEKQLRPAKMIRQEIQEMYESNPWDSFREGMERYSSVFSQVFIQQWHEGIGLITVFKNTFIAAIEEMAAQMLARSAIFGLLSMMPFIGGAKNLVGISGASSFLDFILPFQHGGSFTVGGGGMKDSQLVAFRASPGERVDVTPEGESGGVNITIQGSVDKLVYEKDLVPLLRKIQMGVAV